jgi:hypothetical protein
VLKLDVGKREEDGMLNKSKLLATTLSLSLVITGISAAACKSTTPAANTSTENPAPVPARPGSGAVVNSNSLVTVQIQNITRQATGYPWKLEVLIQNTTDVPGALNPVKDSVGKVVSVVTDQDMTYFNVNNVVPAAIKLVGDVNIPGGIQLYLYNIAPK